MKTKNKTNIDSETAALRKRIKKLGIKQIVLAESLGMSPEYLSAVLNDKVKPETLPVILPKIEKYISKYENIN
jgi:transcriptional regulator with XRE-family HTH domain